jgi:hypothetical protein
MAEIFISHSRRDEDIKSFFSKVFATTPVTAYFVELEKLTTPPAAYIEERIRASKALFILLGPHVQDLPQTQTWIAWEAGLTRGLGSQARKDIWVFEPYERWCEVPIPYLDHYVVYDQIQEAFNYIKSIVMSYDDSGVLPATLAGAGVGSAAGTGIGTAISREGGGALGALFGAIAGAMLATLTTDPSRSRPVGTSITCPNPDCRVNFQVHTPLEVFPCPTCRQWMKVQWNLPPPRRYTEEEIQQFLERDRIR